MKDLGGAGLTLTTHAHQIDMMDCEWSSWFPQLLDMSELSLPADGLSFSSRSAFSAWAKSSSIFFSIESRWLSSAAAVCSPRCNSLNACSYNFRKLKHRTFCEPLPEPVLPQIADRDCPRFVRSTCWRGYIVLFEAYYMVP